MRNLKKILALVLALMMILSLMVTASAAKYEDTADSNYGLAIDLVSGIGVINGTGTGKFNPNGTLKRDQAAKIIAYLALTPDVADILPKETGTFKDVGNYWAAAPIAWAYENGIVAGTGGGNYSPNREVKGYEFAKMLLTAIGYNAESEGLNGSGWSINTATLAKQAGIFNGITGVDFNKPLARGVAAQMAFNALLAQKVRYTGGTTVTVNGVTMTNGAVRVFTGTYLAEDYGMTVTSAANYATSGAAGSFATASAVTGVISANSANNATSLTNGTTTVGSTTCATETGMDLLGHYVTVYGVPGASGTLAKVYAIEDLSTVVTVAATFNGSTAADKAKWEAAFGTGTITAGSVTTVAGSPTITPGTGGTYAATAGTYVVYNNAIKSYTAAPAYTAIKVTAVNATQINGTYNLSASHVYDGIAVNDYAMVATLGGINTITKVQTVEGKITRIDGAKLTINGKVYDDVSTTLTADSTGISDDSFTNDFTNTFKLYLFGDNYFAIEKVTTAAAPSDIVYVTGVYKATEAGSYGDVVKYYAQTVDLNGVEGKQLVGVDTDGNGSADVGTSSNFSGLRTFAANPSDTVYGTMTASSANTSYAPTQGSTSGPVYEKALSTSPVTLKVDTTSVTTTESANGGKAYLNSSTKYLFVNGTGASLKKEVVVGGINFAVPASSKVLLTQDADGNNVVVAVIITTVGAYTDAGATATDMVYVVGNNSPAVTAQGYEYTVYNVNTGAAQKVTAAPAAGGSVPVVAANTGFYTYRVVDGVYTFVAKQNDAAADAAGVHTGLVYEGRYGTKISAKKSGVADLTDIEAGSAKVIDVRSTDTAGVGEVNSLAAIHSLKTASTPKTVTFTCLVDANGVVIIFVTNVV